MQVLLNQVIKWEGKLEACKGYTNMDYSKPIHLTNDPDYKLPTEVIAETVMISAQSNQEIKQKVPTQ